ncbi:MAG: NTP transferase domain-containing protein [Rickettsia sp.]|nr:NTP transferase domain-containing protein [Rickettsia sp.]
MPIEKQILLLAAGKGRRMDSKKNKMLHCLNGMEMILHVIKNCSKVTDNIFLVYSDHIKNQVEQFCQIKVKETILQKYPLGTAHAALLGLPYVRDDSNLCIIYGDHPLISFDVISDMFCHHLATESAITILGFEIEDLNMKYGRIILDKEQNVKKILEFQFLRMEDKKNSLCNSGIFIFSSQILKKYLPNCFDIDTSTQKEFFLTDIIEICYKAGEKISYLPSKINELAFGINTQHELKDASDIYQKYF